MSRRYTHEQKAYALQCLAAAGGDVARTAAALGIPKRTLFRWRQLHVLTPVPQVPGVVAQFSLNPVPGVPQVPRPSLNPVPQAQKSESLFSVPGVPQVSLNPVPVVPEAVPGVPQVSPDDLPPDTEISLEEMQQFQRNMMRKVHLLLSSIEPSVMAAPLPQRVMAAARLTDRIIKLGTQLATAIEQAEAKLPITISDSYEDENFYQRGFGQRILLREEDHDPLGP